MIPEPPKLKTGGDKRRRFIHLWILKHGRNCPQCGVEMIALWEITTFTKSQKKTGKLPDNLATKEHSYSRLNPERGKHTHVNTVLCRKCNHENGAKEFNALPIKTATIDTLPPIQQ